MTVTMRIVEWERASTAVWSVKADPQERMGHTDSTPLIVVHGGPALPHQYLAVLSRLARPGRPVIFYDQVGCGHSRNTVAVVDWTLDLFTAELRCIIETFARNGNFDLIGHSSGGWIALELLLTDSSILKNLRKLILASVPLDIPIFIREQKRIVESLGRAAKRRLLKEPPAKAGRRLRAYMESYDQFLRSFVCRVPWPAELIDAMEQSGREVYSAMWGASEVWPTGIFKDWSCESRVGDLDVPVLLTSGRHDEVTPTLIASACSALQKSKWRLFENSAHMPHIEESASYLEELDLFLSEDN